MKEAKIRNAERREAIEEAAAVIRGGGLVAFPTETVYGLGADATNPAAAARIFEAKQRPSFDPLIVHLSDVESAAKCGRVDSPEARKLIQLFWPGPLTLVVSKTALVPDIVTAGLDTVALRIPAHPVALSLIRSAGCPIAAPSANLFGCVSPTSAIHVAEQLGDRVDLILDGGPCRVGIESTILALGGARPVVLRAGGLPAEELEAALGRLEWSISENVQPKAPGQLSRHYATRTPLLVVLPSQLGAWERRPGCRVGLLTLVSPERTWKFDAVEVLSESGDLREAAANFFAALRRLDNLGLDEILACALPEQGLGTAMMDRLRRCSIHDA